MVPDEAEGSTLEFENVFTGGVLTASYKRGVVILRSDSASTLAIVKEQISKEATARRVHITDAFQVQSYTYYTVRTSFDPRPQANTKTNVL